MNSKDLLQEAAQEFANLRAILEEDGHKWPLGGWQRSQFMALIEGANRKKKLATSLLNANWWETPDPVPQVTAYCPYCGNWYRDDRTICTEGCGGTLEEVKRISLKPRRVTYPNIDELHADSMRRARLNIWPRATPTTEVKK